ncbi:hypothetical protein TWF506_010105 [Arthrobotrys conoides]|uniref:Uncharacterized protein n=1 Tax=Arthrobotrys conoides TaxID=74498 RepID=A0AAN8NLG7_9PEZI
MTYLSVEESNKLSYGKREDMVLDNFFIEVSPTYHPNYNTIQLMSPYNWSVGNDATVGELVKFFVRILRVDEGSEDRYEVVLTHGWKVWGSKWVGILTARVVLTETT